MSGRTSLERGPTPGPAERVDATLQWVSRIEGGGENVTVETMVLFANVLGVTVVALLTVGDEVPKVAAPKRAGRERAGDKDIINSFTLLRIILALAIFRRILCSPWTGDPVAWAAPAEISTCAARLPLIAGM